jgi:hypothetical protein
LVPNREALPCSARRSSSGQRPVTESAFACSGIGSHNGSLAALPCRRHPKPRPTYQSAEPSGVHRASMVNCQSSASRSLIPPLVCSKHPYGDMQSVSETRLWPQMPRKCGHFAQKPSPVWDYGYAWLWKQSAANRSLGQNSLLTGKFTGNSGDSWHKNPIPSGAKGRILLLFGVSTPYQALKRTGN